METQHLQTNSKLNSTPNTLADSTCIIDNKNDTSKAIHFFGGISILDQKKEIIQRFTSQEKELLTLLIIYSTITPYYYNRSIYGVNNKLLTSTLWPNESSNSLKNRKGVLFNKIRNKLKDIDWIKIGSRDGHHFLTIDTAVDMDFVSFILLKNCNMTDKIVAELVNIFSKGTLFEGASFPWLETIQTKINLDIIELLFAIIQNSKLKSSSRKDIAHILLQYDPLNMAAMEFLISEYKKDGQISVAKYLYDQFEKRYKNYFNEVLPKKFHLL